MVAWRLGVRRFYVAMFHHELQVTNTSRLASEASAMGSAA